MAQPVAGAEPGGGMLITCGTVAFRAARRGTPQIGYAATAMADGATNDALDLSAELAGLFSDGIIHAGTLAKLFSSVGRGPWSTRRAKRFLQRSGIGFQMGGPTDEWATTTIELKEHYPQLWRLIESKLADLL